MTAAEAIEMLRANYFVGADFDVRTNTDASGFSWVLVLVARAGTRTRLFGLRLVDYPASPPTLRFWRSDRWDDKEFEFDFTSIGDLGSGTTQSNQGVPTMCIPHHVDYYRGGWHGDKPWVPSEADTLVADLVCNILRRSNG
jgi:hypothetical protein